jgi:DNA polymerase-4
VKKFHGVWPATAEKMQRLGIETGADLKAKSLHCLREHFGKSGVWYYRVARGIDERPVEPDRPRKSVGPEDTFVTDIFELAATRAELRPLVAKIWGHCDLRTGGDPARRKACTRPVRADRPLPSSVK